MMNRLLPLLLMALLSACSDASARRSHHPDGFSFEAPPGWTVESFEGMARAFPEDTSEFVAVGPILPRREQSAADVLQALVASRRLGPLRSPTLVSLKADGDSAIGLLTVMDKKAQAMVVVRGQAGTLYLFGAPAARFDQRRPDLVRILQSFRLGSPPDRAPAPSAPRLAFQRLNEPRERAFSLEFPAGWQTELGVYREGALSPRFESSAVAPDRAITIFLGDRGIGSFTVPTAELAQYGMREGMVYNPSGVNPMPILRYLPGAELARYWLGRRLQGARETGIRQRPDVAQELARARYQFGNPLGGQVHAGELSFAYQGQEGVVTVATEVYGMTMGVQQWALIYFAGYFAQGERVPEARAALAHAVGSARINLEWLRRDRAFAKRDHENIMATIHATNAVFRGMMEERSESAARNSRGIGDTLAGTYRVLDPSTNEYTTVQAGSNFYYRVNDTNTVIGTNEEQAPVDLTRMLRIDWDTR